MMTSNKSINKGMADADVLLRGIEHASKYHLECEYVMEFLAEYVRTKDAAKADWCGICEWDL